MKVLEIKAIFQAHAGAEKMDAAGYKFFPVRGLERVAVVENPEGTRYRVNVQRGKGYCGCPFYAENKICKHRIWTAEKFDRDEIDADRLQEQAQNEANAHTEYLDTLEQGER